MKYRNVEMKIEVTNFCTSACCRHCSPMFRPTVMEAPNELFFLKIGQHVEEYILQGGRKIILTGGGEPCDAPIRLITTAQVIHTLLMKHNYSLELFAMYTNGVHILKPIVFNSEQKPIIDHLISFGIRDIDLSILGLTKHQRQIFSGGEMGNLDHNLVIPELTKRGVRVFIRCTLATGFVDTVEQIFEFASWMDSLGAITVYFSDLFEIPTDARSDKTIPGSKEVLQWTDEHRLDFPMLCNKLKTDQRFTFEMKKTRHADQGNTYFFKLKQGNRIQILLGNLVLGKESSATPTYFYIKPDGSAGGNNNIEAVRTYADLSEIKKYRPQRQDLG